MSIRVGDSLHSRPGDELQIALDQEMEKTQKEVNELKSRFNQRNKVSTIDSHESKKREKSILIIGRHERKKPDDELASVPMESNSN